MSPFAAFIAPSETHAIAAGESIFREGDGADGRMYALLSGSVELVRQGRVLELVSEGGVFGELALIDSLPRSATALAKSDAQVAVISEERFRELILRNPSFAVEIMRLLTRRIRANLER
ncbi:MAG: cyclic nucleotide-binding domain-containing protein [Pseudomonadota bacterium]